MRGSDYGGRETPPEGGGGPPARGRGAHAAGGGKHREQPRRRFWRGRGMPVESAYTKQPRGRYEVSGGAYEVSGQKPRPEATRPADYGEVAARSTTDVGEARDIPAQEWGSPIVGMLTAAAGVVIFLTTFMPWLRGLTGFDLMTRTGFTGSTAANNFLWRVPPGRSLLVFTGFWSMLIGVLMAVAGLIIIYRHRSGGSLATIFGAIGTAISVWTLVNIYILRTGFTLPGVTTVGGNVVPGVGIWIFAIISFVALIHGILGAEGVDNPSNDRLSYGTLPGEQMRRGRPAMR